MLWPERKLLAVEVLAGLASVTVAVAVAVAVWRLCVVLPPGIVAIAAALPLGLAVRLSPVISTLPHRLRRWHVERLSRWHTSAAVRRWNEDPRDRVNGQEDV